VNKNKRKTKMTKAKEKESFTPIPTQSVELGFGDIPGKTYIFIGADEDSSSIWYKWDFNNNKRDSIEAPALIGYIEDVKLVPKIWNGKEGYKLDIHVVADKKYVIRSGVSTSFSNGISHQLSIVEDFSKPIAIAPKKGDTSKVVFSGLFDAETGNSYFFDGERNEKISPLIFKVQEKLGVEIQTTESLKEDMDKERKANDERASKNSGRETSSSSNGPEDI
jgi:hypothetical protein